MNWKVRILLLISVVMYSVGMYGAGYDFTPTDGGQVVNLKQGDRILLSTWVDVNSNGVEDDGEEFFVCHYPGYTGGYFSYTNWDVDKDAPQGKGNILKLIPQAPDATEPASPSIWTIDDPVPFRNSSSGALYTIDGIAYTMWSTNPGGDSYTLLAYPGKAHMYRGNLTRENNNNNLCNAVFIAPTSSARISFDPNNKTGRGAKFDGGKGYGFLGLPYREVFWLDIPRGNAAYSYTNASVVGFNTTLGTIKYSNNEADALPGQALYAFGNKDKHHNTPRTIFRLYILDETTTSSCPDSYFFAFDEQDYRQYNKDFSKAATYTKKQKTYTIDHLVCMERLEDTKYYMSDYMYVPEPDSTYYYVGYRDNFCDDETMGAGSAHSRFRPIDSLKLQYLGIKAPKDVIGRMVIDTTSSAENLGVTFRPAGVFLRTNTNTNIRLVPVPGEPNKWICDEMLHVTPAYSLLTIKAVMYSGIEYSDDDPGVDVPGLRKV